MVFAVSLPTALYMYIYLASLKLSNSVSYIAAAIVATLITRPT